MRYTYQMQSSKHWESRWLTEMVEYGCKIEEKIKSMKSKIKENVQRTNSDRKETGTQINSLEQTEEINI